MKNGSIARPRRGNVFILKGGGKGTKRGGTKRVSYRSEKKGSSFIPYPELNCEGGNSGGGKGGGELHSLRRPALMGEGRGR